MAIPPACTLSIYEYHRELEAAVQRPDAAHWQIDQGDKPTRDAI
jgi:hypothetical protein